MHTPRTTLVAAAATTALAALAALPGTATAVASGPQPRVLISSLGTYSADAGTAELAAYSWSDVPFAGDLSGRVDVTDGSFPPLGVCEPATAQLRLDEDGGDRHVTLAATGEVCGLMLPLGTMYQLQGRWTVVDTDVRKLRRAKGVADVRLLNGQADVYVWGR